MKRMFAQAWTKTGARAGAKVALVLVSGTAVLALATVGGALSSAPIASQFQPDPQFPFMAFDLAPSRASIDMADIAGETIFAKSTPVEALAKGDRMARPIRLAMAGPAVTGAASSPLDLNQPHPIVFSVITEPGLENETYVMPGADYAALELHDSETRFDQSRVTSPMSALPIHPTETPEIAEEEDDAQPATISAPLPRAKPLLDPSLPLPRMRPEIPPAGTILNPGRIGAAKAGTSQQDETPANPGGIPLRQPPKPSSLLAFLTPQGDVPQPSVTPPTTQPPNTIVTPTPFGIPYVLQTQTVDTACLKPELLEILHQVESHYGRKVVITSGYRSRGREGSLHRTCRAADIIVPGISSQALAAYARSIPTVGGVGTYCHQAMIHVDIGTPRDWKYGCGSYFAMRDGSAHWGKVPQETQED